MNRKQNIEIPAELVRRAQAGDREAFGELYQRSGAAIYRTIASMVRNEETAWDIHQNSYLRAWQGLKQLEKPEAFLPWLRRIAVNEAVKELNRERPMSFSELEDGEEEAPELPETRSGGQPELELSKKEAARLVREILKKLPRKQRLIVGMYYYEEYSIREIAEALQVTQGTVKTQLHLGRKRVETEVRRLEGEGVKLCGLTPMAFLVALLHSREPSKQAERRALQSVLSKTAGAGGEPVKLTARAVGSGFFHTAGGKVTAVVLAAAVVAGGVLGYRALRPGRQPAMGDYRPTQTLAATEGPVMTVPAQTAAPEAEHDPDDPLFGSFDALGDSVIGVICSAPFPDDCPTPAVDWGGDERDGAERLIIRPRYAGSTVSASRIVRSADGKAVVEEAPAYSCVCGEGECVGAALERPEDCPCWLVTVRTPEGAEGSWVLLRNSRYGTPSREYLTQDEITGDESEYYIDSEFYGSIAEQMLRSSGYETRVGSNYVYHILPSDEHNPFFLLGDRLQSSVTRALAPYEIDGPAWLWNNYYADEGAVYTITELEMRGDTCFLDAAVVHEYYSDQIDYELYLEGRKSSGISVGETAARQAELFAEQRVLGYAGQTADEGEEVRFHLHGLLVYNPTLSARELSITVNGEDASRFPLTEGEFFTWLPLERSELPGDREVHIEARVTETLFGPPENAILYLSPEMSSIFRGGR